MAFFLFRLFDQVQHSFKPEFAAGANAEKVFEALCHQRNFICERIPQSRESYQQRYARQTGYGKRGDYLLCDLNVEIEVKCRKSYGRERYQYLNWKEIERLLLMQEKTKTPVVFAFFERQGRRAVKDSLRMIPLQDLVVQRKPRIVYSESQRA